MRISLFLAAILLASCVKDAAEHGGLRIEISAGDFASTRADENGYATTFTVHDTIGITVMTMGGAAILEDNVPYKYDGWEWNPLVPTNAVHRYPNAEYLVYYPYDAAMNGLRNSDEILAVFAPKSDQRYYTNYTASDLMTGTGSLTGNSLSVTLEHKLSLVEIDLFADVADVTLEVGGTEYKPYNIDGTVWRCIVKPTSETTLNGQYTLAGVAHQWQKNDRSLRAGMYSRINVINSFYTGHVKVNYAGGGSETVQYDVDTRSIPVRAGVKVESVELPDGQNKTYLIGRSATDELFLNIHGNGDLLLRPAGSDGHVPIGSYAEFQLIATAPDGYYRQESDLDLMNVEWTPIGNESTPFSGIYNGGGYAIANLKIDMPDADNVGLFGYVSGMEPRITGLHIASGIVRGNANVGGICGMSRYVEIKHCTNAAAIEATGENIGGLVGINNLGNIDACSNSGDVTGSFYVGGLAGSSNGGVIACRNVGVVIGGYAVGGIVGINDTGVINSCYNTNVIFGGDSVGGVVGFNSGPAADDDPDYEPEMEDAGIIIGCYNIGVIVGENHLGSVCGLNAGVVMGCYWDIYTADTGVNNSLDDPDFPGTDTDVVNFTMPPGFIPNVLTYPTWDIGEGDDGIANWKNYNGNGGLPQLWWEN